MLVRMAVRTPGLAGQECHTSIPACLPEVDVRPASVVFSAGAADTVYSVNRFLQTISDTFKGNEKR